MNNGLPPIVAEEVDEDPRRQRRLPPPEGASEAKEGEHIPAGQGVGELLDPHTSERAPEALRGSPDDVNLSEISTEWVLKRLVKEANDFGTRTRQTGRLKALELIGAHLGMWGDEGSENEGDQVRRKLREMTVAERRERLIAKMKAMGMTIVPKEKAR